MFEKAIVYLGKLPNRRLFEQKDLNLFSNSSLTGALVNSSAILYLKIGF